MSASSSSATAISVPTTAIHARAIRFSTAQSHCGTRGPPALKPDPGSDRASRKDARDTFVLQNLQCFTVRCQAYARAPKMQIVEGVSAIQFPPLFRIIEPRALHEHAAAECITPRATPRFEG